MLRIRRKEYKSIWGSDTTAHRLGLAAAETKLDERNREFSLIYYDEQPRKAQREAIRQYCAEHNLDLKVHFREMNALSAGAQLDHLPSFAGAEIQCYQTDWTIVVICADRLQAHIMHWEEGCVATTECGSYDCYRSERDRLPHSVIAREYGHIRHHKHKKIRKIPAFMLPDRYKVTGYSCVPGDLPAEQRWIA